MNIENKLSFNNIKRNVNRAIYTCISIILCTMLIFIFLIIALSIKNGITETINSEYSDYHFVVNNIKQSDLEKIKSKDYIAKIYIQKDNGNLEKIEDFDNNFNTKINIYIKYKDVQNSLKYSKDIINNVANYNSKRLMFADEETRKQSENKYKFNTKNLTISGIINPTIEITDNGTICISEFNYEPIIKLIIIAIIIVFSVLSIIILYNAFLITIDERKKEYAILNSIGATEGQIIKIVLLEASITGIVGIAIGFFFSYLISNQLIVNINKIFTDTGYSIRLILNIKYIIIALLIIIFNIFISAIIPCIKASTTTIIQGIRDNKGIHRKRNSLIEKISSTEGKVAIKNIRRNSSKYRIITILLVICQVSYISISTYISYEKKIANVISDYDVDARAQFDKDMNINYKELFSNYKTNYDETFEYSDFEMRGYEFLIENQDNLIDTVNYKELEDGKKAINIVLIGLNDYDYSNYIKKINAKNGDAILYNVQTIMDIKEDYSMKYEISNVFKNTRDLKLDLISTKEKSTKNIDEKIDSNSEIQDETTENEERTKYDYKIIDNETLHGNIVLTDTLIKGFKDFEKTYMSPILFVNKTTFNKIKEKAKIYNEKSGEMISQFIWGLEDSTFINIKSDKLIKFSNYISSYTATHDIEESPVTYFSLEKSEKSIYIELIQYALFVIIIQIIAIGIASTINVMNASLQERKRDFYILNTIGATRQNIINILVQECIYFFVKATIISIIISIPIVHFIIKYMSQSVSISKILVPFGNIALFISILFILSLVITITSTRKFVKWNWKNESVKYIKIIIDNNGKCLKWN